MTGATAPAGDPGYSLGGDEETDICVVDHHRPPWYFRLMPPSQRLPDELNPKESIREDIWKMMESQGLSSSPRGTIPTFPGQNKAAERVRRLDAYSTAQTVMVPPDLAQLQVRVNALMDGKRLIAATPGLRDGFYLLTGLKIGAKNWVRAARSSGIRRYGERLPTRKKSIGRVDLLITGAVAVGPRGERLGKGSGFFDLEYAILRYLGCVTEETPIVGVVDDAQIRDDIPMDSQDVCVDVVVTPHRIVEIERRYRRPSGLSWDIISDRRGRLIRAVRELHDRE